MLASTSQRADSTQNQEKDTLEVLIWNISILMSKVLEFSSSPQFSHTIKILKY